MRKLIFIIAAIIVIVALVVIFFVIQESSNNNQLPTQTSLPVPTKVPILSSTKNTNTVPYNADKSNQFVKTMKDRPPLTPAGLAAKTKLINSLQGNPGTIYSSPNVSIDYLPALDLFQAEILVPNITYAKNDAVSWLTAQGFTNQDTCNLPLNFYMSPSVSQELQNSGSVFNPLPEGC